MLFIFSLFYINKYLLTRYRLAREQGLFDNIYGYQSREIAESLRRQLSLYWLGLSVGKGSPSSKI